MTQGGCIVARRRDPSASFGTIRTLDTVVYMGANAPPLLFPTSLPSLALRAFPFPSRCAVLSSLSPMCSVPGVLTFECEIVSTSETVRRCSSQPNIATVSIGPTHRLDSRASIF